MRQDEFFVNLAVECFWTHARNLIEFFRRPRNPDTSGTAAASDFTADRFKMNFDSKMLEDEINQQITHLQYGRPVDAEQKLNTTRMHYIKNAIDSFVRRFIGALELEKDWKGVFGPREPLTIEFSDAAISATNVVSSTSLSSGFRAVVLGIPADVEYVVKGAKRDKSVGDKPPQKSS
jgi:hypothetical protein